MSASLDLNGTTHTIAVDASETYFQVKDTSALKNGTLVIQAGAKLLFDDALGSAGESPGFAADWVGTLTITGTAANPVEIASVDDIPHHKWTIALGVSGTWTQVRISGNGAYSTTGAVIHNTVVFGYDTYCGVDDVRRLTGITVAQVSDADVSALIDMAKEEINDFTGKEWLTGTVVNEEHDYAGGGSVHLDSFPVQSITTLQYRGGAVWSTKTQGAESDYYASPEDLRKGIVRLLKEPSEDRQAVRVTYIYGEPVMSGKIRKLCAAIAGRDALLSTTLPQKASVIDKRFELLGETIKSLKGQLAPIRPWIGDNADEYRYGSRSRGFTGRTI